MIRQLPIVKIGEKSYYQDDRLKEFRNVNNPHDRLTIVEAYAKLKGINLIFCEGCNKLITDDIKKFKELYCLLTCDQFTSNKCRGVSEEITMCKDCCEESFLDNMSCQGSGFWSENHSEDREESDLP